MYIIGYLKGKLCFKQKWSISKQKTFDALQYQNQIKTLNSKKKKSVCCTKTFL